MDTAPTHVPRPPLHLRPDHARTEPDEQERDHERQEQHGQRQLAGFDDLALEPRGHDDGRTSGNRIVSRIVRPVSMIIIRSTPMPSPPVGCIAYSNADRNSSSSSIASGSPPAASRYWAVSRARCSTGSISSEYAVPISAPNATRSHRSAIRGSLRCWRVSGDTSVGKYV